MDRTDAVTALILETFRLNGSLLAAGDALVADLGLTSARWQVLGAVAIAAMPMPILTLARNMGLSRQAVQRTVNELIVEELLRLVSNPHHRRARLVMLTAKGLDLYEQAGNRQRPWAAALAPELLAVEIARAADVLRTVRGFLEGASR